MDKGQLLAILGNELHTRLDQAVEATLSAMGCFNPRQGWRKALLTPQ